MCLLNVIVMGLLSKVDLIAQLSIDKLVNSKSNSILSLIAVQLFKQLLRENCQHGKLASNIIESL